MARHRPRPARKARLAPAPPTPRVLAPARALRLPLVFAFIVLAFAAAPTSRANPNLLAALFGAGGALIAWTGILALLAARRGRMLSLELAPRRQHYVQACAQAAIFIYWGWYWREVYGYAYLIAAQVAFAYAFDALLTWSRRDTWVLGFGPFPIIFSINLFLWFKPDWFVLQFVLVAVGFAAKELIRWTKEGRRTHIFNPSSFPLSIASIVLILTGTTDVTWGVEIATTQIYPPYIYLLIFLVSLPGQYLFGVASMTLAAVGTTYAFSLAYAAASGDPYFIESYIPIAVFLGMHLLFSDPSTAPRTDLGRIMFGVLYGLSVIALFGWLGRLGIPTFYDKLLGVPLLNLLIQLIDRAARSPLLARLDPTVVVERLLPLRRNLAYMAIWAALFLVMQSLSGNQVALARADTLLAQGRVGESIASYRALLEEEPDHPGGNTKLGYALLRLGQVQQALPLLRRAAVLNPDDPEAHNNLGLGVMQTGRPGEAVASLRRAVELDADYSEAHYNLAHALNAAGDPAGALGAFREALRIRPDWPTALGALAWVRATHAAVLDPDEALALAERAAELSTRSDVAVLDALAAAYAATGRFDEAVLTAEEAVRAASVSAPGLADGIRARLERYRAGLPVVISAPAP